jgi:sec-independent protein translocase protein TatC
MGSFFSAAAAAFAKKGVEDPEHYRMTLGDHLEELRMRMILGLIGFVIAAVFCFIFGEQVLAIFVRPLFIAMARAHINPHINYMRAADPFVVYIEVSMISAAAIASPWMLYQVWQFVAAGLYPAERKYITKYLPLSITLLIAGMLFLYFYVLPISLEFFFRFSNALPLKVPEVPGYVTTEPTTQPVMTVPVLPEDPPHPVENQAWIDPLHLQLKFYFGGETHILSFGDSSLIQQVITLPEYIDMVVGMLLAFGISFQMPLVVLALVRIGIVDIDTLKRWRRIIYFVIVIISAVIIPDVVTGMFMLMIPLIFLYEFGLILARPVKPKPMVQ